MDISENAGTLILIVATTMFSVAAVAVLLRCFVGFAITKAFGVVDLFMVAAMITFTISTATAIVAIHYGAGRHISDVPTEDITIAMMYWWYCLLTYAPTMILAKISIALFLLRLVPELLPRWILKITLVISVLAGVGFFFIILLQCSPISFFWSRTGSGSCISADMMILVTYIYSGFEIPTDLILAIIPIWLVFHLGEDIRTKLALFPIIIMAFAATAAAAVRLNFVQKLRDSDTLYNIVDIALWNQSEQGLAIAAGSFATLRPLFWSDRSSGTSSASKRKGRAAVNTRTSVPGIHTRSSGYNKETDRFAPQNNHNPAIFNRMDGGGNDFDRIERNPYDQRDRDENGRVIEKFQYQVSIESNNKRKKGGFSEEKGDATERQERLHQERTRRKGPNYGPWNDLEHANYPEKTQSQVPDNETRPTVPNSGPWNNDI